MSRNTSRRPSGSFKIAVVSAGQRNPSRTRTLALAIADAIGDRVKSETTVVDLSTLWKQIAVLASPSDADQDVRAAFDAVEDADLLVTASPIFKASYTGAFKHFFDLFAPDALVAKHVILAATGGSERHSLALEHNFRPLFSFFAAHTLPTTVYAVDSDIVDGAYIVESVAQRIAKVADEAALILRQRDQYDLANVAAVAS
ncbi:NAD(P)H-dependent oxidoreductase [Hyphomicrobium sp.]|uniref:NAD(P)H-dependent oxidoreductase n=1 Tax=Hyphomicrobium sp. TaxID=82 RepID=UPI002E2FDE4D|nr:NAD(P)H-dependent oxidoreductase [Hyphomicrobium sp.]HEX2842268.1 NAD(P)H-dependent oxidoreductase [Hyphomicrobium sp.]